MLHLPNPYIKKYYCTSWYSLGAVRLLYVGISLSIELPSESAMFISELDVGIITITELEHEVKGIVHCLEYHLKATDCLHVQYVSKKTVKTKYAKHVKGICKAKVTKTFKQAGWFILLLTQENAG